MRFVLFLCLLFASNVWGHKGLLREERLMEYHAYHAHGAYYPVKPGFVFKNRVMALQNERLFNSTEWQNIDLTGDQNCFYGNQEVPAENLKRAVRKVFGDRYHASRPDEEGFFVNMTQFICDPNVPLWSSLPTTNNLNTSLHDAFEQLKQNSPENQHQSLNAFRKKLEQSPLFIANPIKLSHEISDLVDSALNLKEEQIRHAQRSGRAELEARINQEGILNEIVALIISHAESCSDAVVAAVEVLYGVGVSIKLEKMPNNQNTEKAFLSLCLSLLKQDWIRKYASSLGGGEIIERQLQVNKLVNDVFPMGAIVDSVRYNFGFDPMKPKEVAERLCPNNVAFLVESVGNCPAWKRYAEQTTEYRNLIAQWETLSDEGNNDNADSILNRIMNQINTFSVDKAKRALLEYGYLTRERYYPIINL